MTQDPIIKAAIDWRWLLVSFCFLVLFHLFPSAFASGLRLFFSTRSIGNFLFWGVGGIAIVSGYIGFRSSGKAILEPGIAAALYIVLLRVIVSRTWSFVEFFGPIPFWISIIPAALAIGYVGAMAGAWIYRRRQKKLAADFRV